MIQAVQEFKIGRPQVAAGLLLLAFLGQCFWVAAHRHLSDLEYEYIASVRHAELGQASRVTSPLTAEVAALPSRLTSALRTVLPVSLGAALAIPRPWLIRLPFIIFGLWLGSALWWVARRLFGDEGGYVALALYCFSPAMIMTSGNIGPEIILAWSGFGLIYLSIGVAHTVYAAPRRWVPRIVLLGLSIGVCLSTALWAFTLVLLAFAFMLYLAPGRRRAVLIVLSSASAIGLGVLAFFTWLAGGMGPDYRALTTPRFTYDVFRNLGFVAADGYVLPALFAAALAVYGNWPRTRYFGNTAPLLASFASVLLFALVPAIYLWNATLGLSFVFVFIGGVAADLLEMPFRPVLRSGLAVAVALRAVFCWILLSRWRHQNIM